MSVKKIPLACGVKIGEEYNKISWNFDSFFLIDLKMGCYTLDGDSYVSEEILDTVLYLLAKQGYIEVEERDEYN